MQANHLLKSSAIDAVSNWLEHVVIAKSLCPFAKGPWKAGEVGVGACLGSDEEILSQFSVLVSNMKEAASPETLLVVLPKGYEDFFDFLHLVDVAQAIVDEHFADFFSIASFHPNYQFAALPKNDIVHYIHRSPYPVIHVLRESSLDKAIELYPDIDDIPERNRTLALELGVEFFKNFGKT